MTITARSNRRGGIITGLLSFFGILILVAIAGGFYLANNVRVQTTHRANGENVAIDVPGGHINIQAHDNLDPAALGVPIYPGATRYRHDNGGATFRWTSADGKTDKGIGVAGADYITNDSPDKVLAWYRGQSPHWVVVEEHGDITHLELREGGYKRIVGIKEHHDGTRISVASIGEPASN
jgi:hypothetical protein